MKKKKIWHVYYGTRGSAGAYIDRLQKAAISSGFKSSAFVSSKYRFKTPGIFKFFFPLTDRTEKRNFFIIALRYLELALGYKILFLRAVFTRPIVNLNLIDDLGLTFYFFRLLKTFRIKVVITCHDVLSHHQGLTRQRSLMFDKADKLIVHSKYASGVLSRIVGEKNRKKIIRYPFPSSPYEEILSPAKMTAAGKRMTDIIGRSGDYFLFIGIIRKSKGIETLAEAWEMSKAKSANKLVVAGKWSSRAVHLKDTVKALPNCVFIDKYLNDEEFIYLIKNAKFVILPYKDYAHSAVLFACAHNDGAVICSDIELFTDLLPGYTLTFSREKSKDLAALIDRTENFEKMKIDSYRDILAKAVGKSDMELEQKIEKAYAEVL
ncbi:glycosyltransferase [Acidobacteriota bacterium]